MAFTYGFFNSLKGDRKYNAEQLSSIFDGILKDGIIPSYGQIFDVNTANNGMQITVGTGRAWFNHTWSLNDSVMILTVPQSDITLPRYDAVVLEVNHDNSIRANAIKIVTGVPAVNATKPTLVNTDKIHQYPLAYINVKASAETIKAEDIENMVGRAPTVFATGILETVAIDDLWSQWEGEWRTWFEGIKLQLSGDIVTNLQYQIDQLKDFDRKIIQSDAKAALGLPDSATSNDAFVLIGTKLGLIANDVANMTLTLKTPSGNKIKNMPINGLLDAKGNTVKTNSSGIASGLIKSGNTTLSLSEYTDIAWSKTYTISKGNTYTDTAIVNLTNFVSFEHSGACTFSPNVKSISYSVGGGGGGGGSDSSYYSGPKYHGTEGGSGGGGGGRCIVKTNVVPSINTIYPVTVGAGGYGGSNGSVGRDGGSSSFMDTIASGGTGGSGSNGHTQRAPVGGGCGNPMVSTPEMPTEWDTNQSMWNGTDGIGTMYTSISTEIYNYGGGGAGSVQGRPGTYGGSVSDSTGLGRYGSKGTDGYGGGGGGGWYRSTGSGGSGGSGKVAIRIYFNSN